jgi:hypothetical protein
MGLGQLLRRAQPVLEAALMGDDGESNLDIIRRLATPKFNGLRPRNQEQPTDDGDVPLLLPRDSMMPGPGPNAPPIDPGFTAPRSPYDDLYNRDPGFTPRPMQPGVPALAATSDEGKLLERSTVYPGAPDMSRISPEEILRATARLRERALTPATSTEEYNPNYANPALQQEVEPKLLTRPRRVLSDDSPTPGNEPFGSSGEPFGSARPRRLLPRDYAADDAQYLRDLEREPVEHSRLKSAGLAALRGLAYGPGGALGAGLVGLTEPDLYGETKRARLIQRGQRNLALDLDYRKATTDQASDEANIDYRRAQTGSLLARPDQDARKAETQRRSTLASVYNRLPEFDPEDPANADMVRAMAEAGLPVVPKSRAQQLRFVQDARTGAWQVVAGDRSTGEASASSVLTNTGQPLATTPTAQISSETQAANRTSRERVATLDRTSREAIADLNRRARESRGRGDARTQARLDQAIRAVTALEGLKTDATSGPVQGRASALDKAVSKAAEIRSLYGDLVDVGYGGDSEGRQWPYAKMKQGATRSQQSGAIGRGPAGDGRHHYTAAEIRAQADSAGVSYESLYNKLKGDKRVVIDE